MRRVMRGKRGVVQQREGDEELQSKQKSEPESSWSSWKKVLLVGAVLGLIVCPIGWFFALPLLNRGNDDGTALAPLPSPSFGSEVNFFQSSVSMPLDEQCLELPQFITESWVNPAEIEQITKFGSSVGHPFCVGNSGEMNKDCCESDKHYAYLPEGGDLPCIYSPCKGKIIRVEQEMMGAQVWIAPDGYEDYAVRVFHIKLDSGVKKGAVVEAGQKLGTHFTFNTFSDIAVEHYGKQYGLTSAFCHMTDSMLNLFGLQREDVSAKMVISKEQRAKYPVDCDSLSATPGKPSEDWVKCCPVS